MKSFLRRPFCDEGWPKQVRPSFSISTITNRLSLVNPAEGTRSIAFELAWKHAQTESLYVIALSLGSWVSFNG